MIVAAVCQVSRCVDGAYENQQGALFSIIMSSLQDFPVN